MSIIWCQNCKAYRDHVLSEKLESICPICEISRLREELAFDREQWNLAIADGQEYLERAEQAEAQLAGVMEAISLAITQLDLAHRYPTDAAKQTLNQTLANLTKEQSP